MPVLGREDPQRERRLRAELDRIVQKLADLGVHKVILFGSLARGVVGQTSDVDLIVVYDTSEPFATRLNAFYTAVQPRMAVDLLVYTPQEWERMQTTSSFARAQQAAEKALKGYLYAQGAALVWGYSVAELCEDAKHHDASFAALRPRVAPLDQYYIPTRYPNGLPGGIPAEAFDADDARRALAMASEVLQFVQDRMGGASAP